jgi:hypothetical protein
MVWKSFLLVTVGKDWNEKGKEKLLSTDVTG